MTCSICGKEAKPAEHYVGTWNESEGLVWRCEECADLTGLYMEYEDE